MPDASQRAYIDSIRCECGGGEMVVLEFETTASSASTRRPPMSGPPAIGGSAPSARACAGWPMQTSSTTANTRAGGGSDPTRRPPRPDPAVSLSPSSPLAIFPLTPCASRLREPPEDSRLHAKEHVGRDARTTRPICTLALKPIDHGRRDRRDRGAMTSRERGTAPRPRPTAAPTPPADELGRRRALCPTHAKDFLLTSS